MVLPDYAKGPDAAPFVPRYETDYRLSKQTSGMMYRHYVEGLDVTRKAMEIVSILGGKAMHTHGIVAGGATLAPDVDKIRVIDSLVSDILDFAEDRLWHDVLILSQAQRFL